jgi:hypothetical protein
MPIFADYSNRAEPFMTNSPRGQQWLRAQRSVDDQIKDALVRADSVNGLKMITNHDDSGRPIRTFVLEGNATKRGTWMAPYCAEPHLQLRICKQAPTPAEAAAFEARQVTTAQLQSGNFVLPEF